MVNAENTGVKDAESPGKYPVNYCTGANCSSCMQEDCNREATLALSCSPADDQEVVVMDYKGFKNHKPVEEPIVLIKGTAPIRP